MNKNTSTVTTKGQITIPIAFRNELTISPNDIVIFELLNDKIIIKPITKTIKDFFGYKFKKDKTYIGQKDDVERAKEINASIIVHEGIE